MTDINDLLSIVEKRRFDAMCNADTATLSALLHRDLTYVHSTGITDTKSAFINKISDGTLQYKSIKMDNFSVRLIEQGAVLQYLFYADVFVGGQEKTVTSKVLAIWIGEYSSLKLLAFQSTAFNL